MTRLLLLMAAIAALSIAATSADTVTLSSGTDDTMTPGTQGVDVIDAGNKLRKDFDECLSSPCIHGDCINEVNKYRCHCLPGYTGVHCEVDLSPCSSHLCMNGICVDSINGYRCQCFPGWTGVHCEVDLDECHSSPCIHGDCLNEVNKYRCNCHPGYTGYNCEISSGGSGNRDTRKYNCRRKNPCTEENRQKGHYYFRHTKARKFVQCDAFGKCYVMTCAPGTVWDPLTVTCNHKFNTIKV